MPSESTHEPDDAFVKALVAFEEAATAGQSLASSSAVFNDADQQDRFERAKGALEALGEFGHGHCPQNLLRPCP